MLNHTIKAHRRRSLANRGDSLCIIEFSEKNMRCFACVIPNKAQSTIVIIIVSQVCVNSIIHTDEHGAYCNLNRYSYIHKTVCRKYNFVDRETGVHTQAIESFHNELKRKIKCEKNLKSTHRADFLRDFCCCFNNREDFLKKVLKLIEV
ncbi:hypothetical protein DMUE_1039 [Dictyocoela muelleri]|nr:hypothetical protein DMUE_1039 [Dictyocoela muelleri]